MLNFFDNRSRLWSRGFDATCHVMVGGVATEVLRLADTVKADCVAVGTDSRRGVERLVPGSEAERIMRRARVAVLITPVPK